MRLRPVEQIGGTCWFYSIINLIIHSNLLKRNLQLMFKKNTEIEMYDNVLYSVKRGMMNIQKLQELFSHILRTKKELIYGADYQQRFKFFRYFLMKLGLPRDVISPIKKAGYTLIGKFITIELENDEYHDIVGVYNSFRKPVIIDSAYKTVYNIDWRYPDKRLKYHIKRIWNKTGWSKSNVNISDVWGTQKIYARKI